MPFHERDITVGGGDQGHILAAKAAYDFAIGKKALTVAVNAGGTGYTAGDVLTVTGGTLVSAGWEAQVEVLTVAAGVVSTVRIKNCGAYSTDPGTTGIGVTGGTGTGATFNFTWQNGWTSDLNSYTNSATEFEWIAHGVNGSGSNPYIGMQTFTSGGNTQIQPMVCTSYSGSFPWHQQPGISRVRQVISSSPRIPVPDATIRVFFFGNLRRMVYIFRNAPSYEMAYMGLFNPFVLDPANDYPLPLIVSGTIASDSFNSTSVFSLSNHSCLVHGSPGDSDRHWIRRTDGAYGQLTDHNGSGFSTDGRIWPFMQRLENAEVEAVNIDSGTGTINPTNNLNGCGDGYFNSGGQADSVIAPAPIGSSGRAYLVVPQIIVSDRPGSPSVIGELDGIFAINGRGNQSEDRVDIAGIRYVVFPNCNAGTEQLVYCMAEN